MAKCLVTTLKESVLDDTLTKIDELLIETDGLSSLSLITPTSGNTLSANTIKGTFFRDGSTSKSITGDSSLPLTDNTAFKLKSKYDIYKITLAGGTIKFDEGRRNPIDIIRGFKSMVRFGLASNCKILNLTEEDFINLPVGLKELVFENGTPYSFQLYYFSKLINLSILSVLNTDQITGTIESFSEGMVTNGKDSGITHIVCNSVITINGANTLDAMQYKVIFNQSGCSISTISDIVIATYDKLLNSWSYNNVISASELPSNPSDGETYFIVQLGKNVTWNLTNSEWIDSSSIKSVGTMTQRLALTGINTGFRFYDITNNGIYYYNGTSWSYSGAPN